MDIIQLAEQKDEWLKDHLTLDCPNCQEKYYSPFDRCFIEVYGQCYTCIEGTGDEVLNKSDNIFAIL